MYAETISRVLNQLVLVSGLLAGFSFAAILALMVMGTRPRVVTATIVAFLLSTALLLYTAMAGTLTLAYPIETLADTQFARIARAYPLLQWPFRLGLLAFLSGIGLAGWIRSKRVGLASTILAGIVLVGWLAWAAFLRGVFGR
jgi:hypothetical protein